MIIISKIKSNSASKVLQLMDEDFSYKNALDSVLKSDETINKKNLEIELNNFI